MEHRQKVILISDPNSDPDDLASYITLVALHKQGFIDLCAAVTTAGCREVREKRARFASAVFRRLGFEKLPVAVGCDYPLLDVIHENNFWHNPAVNQLLTESGKISGNALKLMKEVLENAEDNSVVLLLNAPMADAGQLVVSQKDLCLRKINKIVVMGGIGPETDGQGLYRPSAKSYNNKVCYLSAQRVFEFAQKNGIKLILMPKETVYQAQIGRTFYDELKNSDNLLAQALWEANYQFISYLWESLLHGDYSHFDIRRFAEVFMGKEFTVRSRIITARSPLEKVWDNIRYFNMYDALAALAVVEEVYEPAGYYEQTGEKNIFIAKIRDADMLRNKMCSMIKQKLN